MASKAKKMFKDLDYFVFKKTDDFIIYRRLVGSKFKEDELRNWTIVNGLIEKEEVYAEVVFVGQCENVVVRYTKKNFSEDGAPSIDMKLLKAIEQQFKELCLNGGGDWEY